MKDVFLDLFKSLKKASLQKKIILSVFIFFYIILMLAVFIKVDYQVTTPGGISSTVSTNADLKDYWVVNIEQDNLAGNINTVGVYNHKQISYFQYLISKLSSRITIEEYNPRTMLSKEEDVQRGIYQKDYSIIDALVIAYEAAALKDPDIHIEYQFQGLLITAVMKYSESMLQVGDIIQSIDDNTFNNIQEFRTVISEINKENFQIKVLRDNETVEFTSKLTLTEDGYKLGVEVHESIIIDEENTKPSFKINKNLQSIGSSGGAMMALAIYNSLTSGDLTEGRLIIGTGTINLDGSVGAIGGVPQKIATASMYDVDIFFIGEANYEEALNTYNELKSFFKPDFKLIKVNTFQEIIRELEALNEE